MVKQVPYYVLCPTENKLQSSQPSQSLAAAHPLMDTIDKGVSNIEHGCAFAGTNVIIRGSRLTVYVVPAILVTTGSTILAVPFGIRSLIKYGDLRAIPNNLCDGMTSLPHGTWKIATDPL